MRYRVSIFLFLFIITCTLLGSHGQWIKSCSIKAGVGDWLVKYETQLRNSRNAITHGNNIHPKEKVRYLGKILKCYVESLRAVTNRQVELLFLIDSSSSIGEENFIDELKFVKKLLADFTVDQNNTRVSVVTFSSRDLVVRHIDHLAHPDDDHHKCSLLDGLQHIGQGYKGGGTFTKGALLEAQTVFGKARPYSKKAVFLITDGYSNYGNPVPAAEELKRKGAEIFTFGIKNGNPIELLNMSSSPKIEHTYILDSFEEFEALARRALHKDLHAGTYIKQIKHRCNKLCKGSDCCDHNALCACGTHTGKYECMCFPGYYGSGLRGECTACPAGTYKNYGGPGDRSACKRCPDPNHTSSPGSTSVRDCRCIPGYGDTGQYTCAGDAPRHLSRQPRSASYFQAHNTTNTCPSLSPPPNGYFVQDNCNNVVHAACGIRCKPGYKLQGSGVRLCQENGTWTGYKCTCIVKKCQKLRQPQFGHMMCSKDDFSFETVCQFSCYSGFKLYGSKTRTCLAIAFWNGIHPRCKEVRCNALKDLTDGRVDPPTCTTRMSPFGTRCTFTCRPGYKMVGPYSKQCTEDGVWTPNDAKDNMCIDVAPPMLNCPMDLIAESDEDENNARVNWEIPFTIDNSGYLPTLTSIPALVPPTRIPIGKTTVTYVAEDNNGNKAKCHFNIAVRDKQPPRIDKCTSPDPFIKKHHRDKPLVIEWEEPLFSDNSQHPLEIRKTHKPGQHFDLGYTKVVYTAIDRSGNNVSCVIIINVKEHACANPPKPKNGDISCVTTDNGLKCSLICKGGYGFVDSPPNAYYCDFDTGTWSPSDRYPFPDCSVSKISSNVIKRTEMKFKSKRGCENRLFLNQIETMIEKHVSQRVDKYCQPGVLCSVENFNTDCVNQDDEEAFDNEIEILTNRIDESIGNPDSNRRRKREVEFRYWVRDANYNDNDDDSEAFGVSEDYDYLPPQQSIHKNTVKVGFDITGKKSVDKVKDNEDQEHLKETVEDVSEKVKADLSAGVLKDLFKDPQLDFDSIEYKDVEPVFTCPIGDVLQNNTCVQCPVGTYFNVVSESCEACNLGTYQPGEGQQTCLWCPPKTSTSRNNSKTLNECKGQCLPGSFSADGLENCETCHIGFYQPEYASMTCSPCPEGSTTWKRGTRHAEQCGVLCPEGEVSKTGLQPCFPCPRGYFQPDRGKSSCYLCPGDVRTEKPGATNVKECVGISDISILNFKSIGTSEIVINECFKEPCQNNASCVTLQVGYVCNCHPGWTGLYCESDIDECGSQPCQNNATCTDSLGQYNCTCAEGYTGINCEINEDDCTATSCYNNATCVDDVVGFHCLCETGFTGDLCNENIDDCIDNPCGNGTCIDEVASFSCVCNEGFTGENCEVEVDECISAPCYNNATCIDVVCGFTCHCVPGYQGDLCDEEINECLSSPCVNGGTCFDGIAGYHCRCPPSYTGEHCQQQLASNFDLVFPTSSVTDYSILYRVYKNLTQISLGFWMKTNDDGNYGTVISYATEQHDNTFTLMDYSGFVLYINGEREVTDLVADDSRWHHLFVTWSSEFGNWQLYQDGALIYSGTGLAKGTVIQAGGALVLGQEQDIVGGNFSAQESFVGNLTAVNMWDRNLTKDEIQSLVWGCDNNFHGDVVAWADFLQGITGHVYKKQSEFCTGCDEPETIMNGTVSWSGLTLKSISNYTCDPGFEMDASGQRECLIDSTWSGPLPICKKKNCGYPGHVPDASMQGFYHYTDSVTYTCNNGYRIIGNQTITCMANGQWDSQLPTCQEIKCERPPFIPYLMRDVRKSFYSPGDVLKVSCTQGRKLFGPQSIICGQDGKWDGPFASCNQVFCYGPPSIENGRSNTSVSESTNINSYVLYHCNEGYVMTGLNRIQCLMNGSWSLYRPVCTVVKCEQPTEIEHGQIQNKELSYNFKFTVSYECLGEYKVNGSNVLECLSSGLWNTSFPECTLKECNDPESIENGYAESDDSKHYIDSRMEYKCFKGHIINGNATRICLSNETWSGIKPTCQPVECEAPPIILYGTFDSPYNVYGSETLYKCKNNYHLIGSSKVTCNENGTWSGNVPYCVPLNCSVPTDPEHGRVIGTRFTVGSTIEYMCDAGYRVQGQNKQRSCLDSLEWEGVQPSCEIIQCSKPIAIEFGGSSNIPPYKPGTVIKYTCIKGYEISGKDTRTCRIDGTWTGPTPQCKPITCKRPKTVNNGKVMVKDTMVGSTAEYLCDQGYETTGAHKRTCGDNKDWTGSDPVCVRSLCPTPQTIAYGTIKGESHEVGANITYQCNEGYIKEGPTTLTCLTTKVWSNPAPTCKPIECDKPADVISNGRMISEDFSFGSTIRYVCDGGYFMDGPTSRTCQADGTWDNPIPVCEKVECPRPLKPPNCAVDGFDFRYKEHVSYVCRAGYQLVGPNVRTCQADKTWTGSQPKCVRLECPEPEKPENGKVLLQGTYYNNEAKYQCFQGYWLVGDEIRVCQRDRTWSGEVPRCDLILCGIPPVVDNTETLTGDKYTAGQVVEYKCKLGYYLADASNLTCSAHGNYSGNTPRCIMVQCKELEPIENGYVLKDSKDYGAAARYACKPGFNLEGNDLRKCLGNSSWSGVAPNCIKVECHLPDMITNGFLNATRGFDYDNIISYSCKDGYEIRGSSERKCLADGTWSGEKPECMEGACKAPIIPHGYITDSEGSGKIKDHVKKLDLYVTGISIGFKCEEGFDLWGPNELNCLKNKSWDGPVPTCERVKCPEPRIENADITATHGFVYNYRVLIKCEDGYSLNGASEIYCMSNKSWSVAIPQCDLVTCDPPELSNGKYSVAKSPNRGVGYPFGLTLRFQCNSGYTRVGEPLSTCSERATWSPDIPVCTKYKCPKPTLPSYARHGLHIIKPKEEYNYNETVWFGCNKGYEVNGSSSIVCGENKTWSDKVPACQSIECPKPVINNGIMSSQFSFSEPKQFYYNTEVFFKCANGYGLVGEKKASCQANKTWSDVIPTCVAIKCPPLIIPNSRLLPWRHNFTYSYHDNVSVNCDVGYELLGDDHLTCQANGSWSTEIPLCSNVQCVKPDVTNAMIEDVKRLRSDRYLYYDVIKMSCYKGFTITGVTTLACQEDGSWSHDLPVCDPVPCPNPSIENGVAIIIEILNPHSNPALSYVFGTIVNIECDFGYKLEGPDQNVCQEQGTWLHDNPVCVTVECPQINITNSQINTTDVTHGSKVGITCDRGYELFGDSSIGCGIDGKWRGLMPVCQMILCPSPLVDHGKIIGKTSLLGTYIYGDTITVTCEPGLVLIGSGEINCLQNRSWSSDMPECQRLTCDNPPSSIRNGKVSVDTKDGRNNSYEAMVLFSCDIGYELTSNASVSCQQDRTWTNAFPQCLLVFCSTPYLVNGVVHEPYNHHKGNNFTFGDSVRFTCNVGYYVKGEKELLCLPSKNWTSPFPTCHRKSCDIPKSLEHGYTNGTSYLYEDIIYFSCSYGYELSGPHYSTCLGSGSWSDYPKCSPVACPVPGKIDNGEYTNSSFKYQDKLKYICNEGYTLIGKAEHFCHGNKTWSSDPPLCTKIACTGWRNIENGRVARTKEGYYYDDEVSISCNEGYKLQGPDKVKCLSTGEWDELISECVIVKCFHPGKIQNGRVNYTSVAFNSVVQYRCEEGFKLSGVHQRKCLKTGYWSEKEPRCDIVRCSGPNRPAFKNGFIIGSVYTYNSTLRYRCSQGYGLQGVSQRTCHSNGYWSGYSPRCLPVDCKQPAMLNNGNIVYISTVYRSEAEYKCYEGYNIKGSSFRRCLSNAEWSGTQPMCHKVVCPIPVNIDNGYYDGEEYTFSSKIVYHCKDKYDLKGSKVLTCGPDGRWIGTTPHCSIRTCENPGDLVNEHVIMVGDDFTAGSSVTFQCDEGYQLVGNSKLTCQVGANWDGQVPQCDKVSCGLPKLIDKGITDDNSYEYGDTVKVRCAKGFTIDGYAAIKCQANGKWSPIKAKCIPISCGQPDGIPHGSYKGDNYRFGDYIFYRCDEGYEITGNNAIQCNVDGSWEGERPSCHMVSCGNVPVIHHASTLVAKTTYGSKAMYKCNIGYQLIGSAMAQCIANGTWRYEDRPKCVPEDCGQPESLNNGDVTYNGTGLGSTAEYFCNEGYVIAGPSTVECVPGTGWNGSPPRCLKVSCSTPVPPFYGTVQGASYDYQSKVVFSCKAGYELQGDHVRVCDATGQWSGTNPKCTVIECGSPGSLRYGQIKHKGYEYKAVVYYSCNHGYHLVGNNTATCTEWGEWSSPLPACLQSIVDKPCPSPPALDNMDDVDGLFIVGDTIQRTCISGYTATGDLATVCQEDLSWTPPVGQCIGVSCGVPSTHISVVVHGNTYNVGDTVRYFCQAGLKPLTPTTITCKKDGNWDHTPLCKAHCKFPCQNGGKCIRRNKCKCLPGWGGGRCQQANCILPCLNGGTCTAPYQCTCLPGYTGPRCQSPICEVGCKNGGKCVKPNKCACPHGYKRPFCDPKT